MPWRCLFSDLTSRDPGNNQWQRDLSVSWDRLAYVREAQDDETGALTAWREALAVSERLATDFPDSVDMQTTQVVHLAGVARHLNAADPAASAEAKALLDRALAVLRPLAEAGRLDAKRQSWIGLIEQPPATTRHRPDRELVRRQQSARPRCARAPGSARPLVHRPDDNAKMVSARLISALTRPRAPAYISG